MPDLFTVCDAILFGRKTQQFLYEEIGNLMSINFHGKFEF